MMLALFIHLLCCTSQAPSSSGTTVTATHIALHRTIVPLLLKVLNCQCTQSY